ncbi:hypothetical protein [Sphingobium chlorophenolicum]|uniref:UGSC-like domain-containing protein n=1 Tax=Sphingobium chlorophenolicum TaxID=46429 RepID=A0A081RGU8_SPHCR|nr:hypothetical protein [Sphingobium chlorophenolicum]KEQ54421.1 hypothetical protein BV95_01229 [Sphingobium chlorophenolicum]
MTIILDPGASLAHDIADPGPDAGELAGRKIAIRIDMLWRSWDWVSEIWAEALRAEGAEVTFWRSCGRTGEEGEQADREYGALLAQSDMAIVGLGNCGSCTSWTIADALTAAATGIPTIAVATAHFEGLANNLAKRGGRSGLRLHVLPYPLDILPKEQVHDIARNHYRSFLRNFGVRSGLAEQSAA